MGLIANLLNKKSVPKDKVDSSLIMLDRLKQTRDKELSRYLDLVIDPRKIPPPSEPSTLEDLDQVVPTDSKIYSPPVEAVVYQDQALATSTDADNPIEAGINSFFDEFARQASTYNLTAGNEELRVGIQRPSYSGETFPDGGGKPVFNAILHTAHWGIFFFGHDASIDVYLLPYDAENAATFKDVKSDTCEPLLAVTTRAGEAGIEWYVDGKRFPREHVPDLAKDLLNDLLHAASG